MIGYFIADVVHTIAEEVQLFSIYVGNFLSTQKIFQLERLWLL